MHSLAHGLEARPSSAIRDPVDAHIGSRLRLRRKTLGLSQSALADQLDVTYQQVCKYESGDNRISASKLFAAAGVLSCPISFFFEGLRRGSPEGQSRDRADQILSQFLSRPDGLQLAGAFPRIRSRRLRRHVMRLVNCLVEETEQAGQARLPKDVS